MLSEVECTYICTFPFNFFFFCCFGFGYGSGLVEGGHVENKKFKFIGDQDNSPKCHKDNELMIFLTVLLCTLALVYHIHIWVNIYDQGHCVDWFELEMCLSTMS